MFSSLISSDDSLLKMDEYRKSYGKLKKSCRHLKISNDRDLLEDYSPSSVGLS